MKNSFFIFLLLLSINSFSSHIVGGGFKITKQSGSYYKFEFQMYVDAHHADPGVIDSEVSVDAAIFDKGTNIKIASIVLPRIGYQILYYANSCFVPAAEIKTGVITFSETIYLDPALYSNTSGYYVVHENCCRPLGVTNIVDSYTTAMAFYSEFPPLVTGGNSFTNSSPGFPSLNDSFASLGYDFLIDFSSTDVDGDSLAYHLVTPLAGHYDPGNIGPIQSAPYAPVVWEAGYSLTTIITGTIPLEIDEETGMLKLNADQEGMFIFAVETEEYRDGIKIGSVIREFRIFTVNTGTLECLTNTKSSLSENNAIHISPNPCRDQLEVEYKQSLSESVEVEVLNYLCHRVNHPIRFVNNSFIYSTADLIPGVYFLLIKSDSDIVTKTFIKE